MGSRPAAWRGCYRLRAVLAGLLWCVSPTPVTAADAGASGVPVAGTPVRPSIALIIDDLGNQDSAGRHAIALPGPVACSFLPGGHFTRQLAIQAHAHGKEVMLHLPMQSVDEDRTDPGELLLNMTHQQLLRTLRTDLAAVPYVSGINNHRGSLITRHPGHMTWLMQALRRQGGLFFVDSRTTGATVASRMAAEAGVPAVDRNVFLDNERSPAAITAEFRRLVRIARRDGTALGIGHPYPETLDVLARELARRDDYNIDIVSVHDLIGITDGSRQPWRMSLYH